MPDQHRATPEQWADQEKWAIDDADSSCILELRARVEALEAAAEPWKIPAGHISGIQYGPALPPRPAPAPACSLVERVRRAIGDAPDGEAWDPEARAAIREVAAWLNNAGDDLWSC